MANFMEIPDTDAMREYFQTYIDVNKISTSSIDNRSLSRHAAKCFTKLGKDLGFYVRASNIFKNLTTDIKQYPNDGGLLEIDLVWLTDNPYHLGDRDAHKYDFYNTEKEKSEIALAFEYEKTGGILDENDEPVHQCDELWKLSFVMARVKVLIYATSTDKIEKHLAHFRTAISNFTIQQQQESEWRIFAINNDRVISRVIVPHWLTVNRDTGLTN